MRLKAAVIGCGRMGAFTSEGTRRWSPDAWFPLSHAEAISAHPELELAAAADASPEALERVRGVYPQVQTFSDVALLAEAVRPALAGVATRTVGRAEVLETLHAFGTRAFHVEKPLCNSMAELGRLEALFGRDDTHVTYGAIRRTFDIYREAKAVADSSSLGALREVRVNMGAASLYWTQAHAIDLILFGAGDRRVVEVQARLGPVERDGAVIQNDPVIESATVWFEDGVAGHIGRAPGLDFILSCDGGEAIVRSDGRTLEIAAQAGEDPYLTRREKSVQAREPLGALRCVHQLVECLKSEASALAGNGVIKRDILRGQQIAFGLVQSHLNGGRAIPLEGIDPAMIIWAATGGRHA